MKTTTQAKEKIEAETLEALQSVTTGAGPRILEPKEGDVIDHSPIRIRWTPGNKGVMKWWLSVGHAPRLDDYFSDEYGPHDDLSQPVKVELIGGDVYILLEYQLNDGSYGELPIVECQTKDCTENPCHEHTNNHQTGESYH